MIRQRITLRDYNDWEIYAYYSVTTYYLEEIMQKLWEIGVEPDDAQAAYNNMSSGKLDTGLCYSNYKQRKTILVIARTSSADEFLNSLVHEVTHACVHISNYHELDLNGERFAYMMGELCKKIYPIVRTLLKEKHYDRQNQTDNTRYE